MQPLPKPLPAYVHTDADKKSVPVVGINIRRKGSIVTRCQLKHSSGTILALFFFLKVLEFRGHSYMSCFLVEKKGEAVIGMMTVPLNDILVFSYLNR